jgi:hypothetical protein
MYRLVAKAELAIIPNADLFTIAGQFEIATMILTNLMQSMIGC